MIKTHDEISDMFQRIADRMPKRERKPLTPEQQAELDRMFKESEKEAIEDELIEKALEQAEHDPLDGLCSSCADATHRRMS